MSDSAKTSQASTGEKVNFMPAEESHEDGTGKGFRPRRAPTSYVKSSTVVDSKWVGPEQPDYESDEQEEEEDNALYDNDSTVGEQVRREEATTAGGTSAQDEQAKVSASSTAATEAMANHEKRDKDIEGEERRASITPAVEAVTNQ